MPETVVADANVLYGNDQRNIFMTLSVENVISLRWTNEIEAEWVRHLSARRHGIDAAKIARTTRLMKLANPSYDVVGYRDHLCKATTTHAKDRHVAAAAIGCAPSVLVTWNLKDFGAAELAANGVVVSTPDSFLLRCFAGNPEFVYAAVRKAFGFARGASNRIGWEAYLHRLGTSGDPSCLSAFAARIRDHDPFASAPDEPDLI